MLLISPRSLHYSKLLLEISSKHDAVTIYDVPRFFFQDVCRSLRFTNAIPGFALSNHVIGEFRVNDEEQCKIKCFLEKSCFSYNYGPSQRKDFSCELNDADSSSHPEDLFPRDEFVYQRAEVIDIFCSNLNLLEIQ